VAIAAGATLVVSPGKDGRPGVSIAAADVVLERAAAAAEQQPFTPPRDEQWVYIEDRFSGSRGAPGTWQTWRRADGGGYAWIENGTLHVEKMDPPRRAVPTPFDDYKSLSALPTDPDALLRWAYEQAETITDRDDVYLQFTHMLRSNVLPPDLQAAIYRAIARVPDVTVETIDVFGRPAIVLAQTTDRVREELLLDPETYAYLGERRGDVVSQRVTAAIVDEPGARP